jgi:hypothetical protein
MTMKIPLTKSGWGKAISITPLEFNLTTNNSFIQCNAKYIKFMELG